MIKNILSKSSFCAIAFVVYWLTIKIILYLNIGTKISNDSPRYIEYADYLITNGDLTFDFMSHYIAYSAFIAFFKFLGFNIGWIIFAQLIISGLACHLLFSLALKIYNNVAYAYTTIFFYTSWIYVQAWDFYILTESLFVSCTIALVYVIVSLQGFKKYFLSLVLILIISTLRPNGFVVAICFAGYELYTIYFTQKKSFITYSILISVCLIAVFWYVSLSLFDFYNDFISPNYAMGEIISGYPQLRIESKGLIPPQNNGNPFWMIVEFVANNPIYSIKLFFSKGLFFWAHVKPYYSALHNCLIILILYPSYFCSIATLKSQLLPKDLKIFFIIYISLQTMIVIAYMEDWDGRFLAPILPFVFLLAAPVIYQYVTKILLIQRLRSKI